MKKKFLEEKFINNEIDIQSLITELKRKKEKIEKLEKEIDEYKNKIKSHEKKIDEEFEKKFEKFNNNNLDNNLYNIFKTEKVEFPIIYKQFFTMGEDIQNNNNNETKSNESDIITKREEKE